MTKSLVYLFQTLSFFGNSLQKIHLIKMCFLIHIFLLLLTLLFFHVLYNNLGPRQLFFVFIISLSNIFFNFGKNNPIKFSLYISILQQGPGVVTLYSTKVGETDTLQPCVCEHQKNQSPVSIRVMSVTFFIKSDIIFFSLSLKVCP